MSNNQKRKRCGSEPPSHAPGVQTPATKKAKVEGSPSMFVPPTNIEEVNQKRKWEGEEATGKFKRLRSVEPEMLKPEVRKPEGEKKEKAEEKKEKVESGATSAGGFSSFANGPSGFGTFKSAEKAACSCLDKYEGLAGKVVNGRFIPNLVQSAQAGTFGAGFNFGGYREPKKAKPKEEHPKEETPKEKQKKSAEPEEKPKAREQEKKPKTWARVETEFVEPEKKFKKEHRRKGEYHDENLASKMKIPEYKPKPAPRPEKQEDGDSNTFKSFDSVFEPSKPLNKPQKKPGKVNLKISETFDTVRGEKVKRFASQEYRDWVKTCMAFFGQQKTGEGEKTTADAGMSTTSTTNDLRFPKITRGFCKLEAHECVKGERIDCCQHDVQRCLRGSAVNTEGEAWLDKLKKERIRWHPDKFAHKMGKQFEKEAQEFFQILQALVKKAEKDLGK
jgi:hypothetical protein